MTYPASLFQIANLAVKAEKIGEKFYYRLAAKQKDGQVKKILHFFAEQEQEHAVFFQNIADEAKNNDIKQIFSTDVISLINEGINQIEKGMGLKTTSPTNILNVGQSLTLALNIEEETVRIYTEIQNALDEKHNAVMHKIINEEKKHAQLIRDIMRQANLETPSEHGGNDKLI